MPIHEKILKPRQAEAGKIKAGGLGEKRKKSGGKTGEYQLPVKYDHFILTTTERGDDGNFELDDPLMKEIPKDKDGKIRRLPIALSSDIIEEIFPETLACYKGKSLYCKGDGTSARKFELRKEQRDGETVTIKTGRSKAVSCPCTLLKIDDEGLQMRQEAADEKGLVCKPHATLWATIVAGEQTQIGARHSFRTTSWDSIKSIKASLIEIQNLVGTLVGPLLTMHIRPRKVRPKGSTRTETIYAVYINCVAKDIQELRERVLAQAQIRHNVAAMAGRPLRLGLPAPGVGESATEQARIQQEYHPDEDDEDDVDFDPETGEVYDTSARDPDSAEPAHEDTMGFSDESQAPPSAAENAALPLDHQIRERIKDLVSKAAHVRGFEGETLETGRKEIWAEAVEKAGYPKLAWRDLTMHRAAKIDIQLDAIIKTKDDPF